jgi:glutaredoxin 3
MSPWRDAPSLIWPGETWHRSFVGRDRGPTRQAEIRAAADSGSIREEKEMEKTEGDMEQLSMALYGKTQSLSCWRIKRLLGRRGYAFELVDVTEDGSRAWLRETTGSEALPQLFVAGRLVGGFRVIKALDRSGDLDRLVRGKV